MKTNGRRPPHEFVRAEGFWLWLLDRLACDGLTMPWCTIYMRPEHFDNQLLRIHELAHIDQIGRLGAVRFSLAYLYYQVRFGYFKNPFEIEAYAIQAEAERLIKIADVS